MKTVRVRDGETEVRVTVEIDEGMDEPLKVVEALAESFRDMDGVLREWVHRARDQGNSWQAIADALKVTRQSAWERFKDLEETPDQVLDSVIGSLEGRLEMTSDEMRRIAREEEAELENLGKTP